MNPTILGIIGPYIRIEPLQTLEALGSACQDGEVRSSPEPRSPRLGCERSRQRPGLSLRFWGSGRVLAMYFEDQGAYIILSRFGVSTCFVNNVTSRGCPKEGRRRGVHSSVVFGNKGFVPVQDQGTYLVGLEVRRRLFSPLSAVVRLNWEHCSCISDFRTRRRRGFRCTCIIVAHNLE